MNIHGILNEYTRWLFMLGNTRCMGISIIILNIVDSELSYENREQIINFMNVFPL